MMGKTVRYPIFNNQPVGSTAFCNRKHKFNSPDPLIPSYNYDGPCTSATVTRRFEASPKSAFDAWTDPETDPEIAGKRLFINKSSKTTSELVVREGGSYTITGRKPQGEGWPLVSS